MIDSALNNHQRFVRGQLQTDMVFPGYDQDRWVAVQRYQEADWQDLIDLWKRLNLRMADLMEDYVGHLERHLNQILTPPFSQ